MLRMTHFPSWRIQRDICYSTTFRIRSLICSSFSNENSFWSYPGIGSSRLFLEWDLDQGNFREYGLKEGEWEKKNVCSSFLEWDKVVRCLCFFALPISIQEERRGKQRGETKYAKSPLIRRSPPFNPRPPFYLRHDCTKHVGVIFWKT